MVDSPQASSHSLWERDKGGTRALRGPTAHCTGELGAGAIPHRGLQWDDTALFNEAYGEAMGWDGEWEQEVTGGK